MMSLLVFAACGSGAGEQSNSETDTIAPQAGQVLDGPAADIDSQEDTTALTANWSGFVDDSGSIAEYEWAIGTAPGGIQVQGWTSVGTATTASKDNLVLQVGQTYFCAVRAYDAARNVSAVASSDGVLISDPPGGGGDPPPPPPGVFASSISYQGITWQFAEDEQVGQFANGDWWVLGPIEIISISPPTQVISGRTINGSMVNPTTAQMANAQHGYDSTLYGPYANQKYQDSLNVARGLSQQSPLQLGGSTSLISTISWTDSNPPSSGSFSQLRTAVVLTVLDAEPASGSFRPPYSGSDKTIRHNEADLDYTALASLPAASSQPSFEDTADRFERVWLDHCSGWSSRYLHPIDNMPDYGRDFTSLFGTGALMLQLDKSDAEKRDLLVRLTQIGIDFFGNVQNGGVWTGVGGQCSGRKFPILLAGKVLNDASMLALGATHPSGYFGPGHPNNSEHFGEDCQTFYVTETSPGTWNWGHGNYTSADNNNPEWGNSHTQFPQNDNQDWFGDSYRRCCTGNAWVGQTLAARIMGLRAAWDHPSYFDYMDRFMQTETAGEWTRSWQRWQGRMWDLHRSNF